MVISAGWRIIRSHSVYQASGLLSFIFYLLSFSFYLLSSFSFVSRRSRRKEPQISAEVPGYSAFVD